MTPEVPKQKIPDVSSTVPLTGGLDMIESQIIGSKNDGGHNSNSSDGASTSSNTKVEKLPQTVLISESLLAIASASIGAVLLTILCIVKQRQRD